VLAFDLRRPTRDAPRFAYVDLVRNLVVKEIRIRYMGAWLGFAWSLANPLLTTLVYYVVFTFIMPTGQPRYALYIVAGVVHWGLLTQLVGRSGDWFIDNSALLRKMRFPHLLIPLANFLAGLSFWLVALVIFFALFPLLQGHWHPALLLYPVYLLLFVAMIGGLCLVMSVAQVFFRDTKHLADVTLGILFWMTPIVYRIDGVPAEVAQVIRWNPVVPFFNCFHAMLYDGAWPTTSDTLLSLGWAAVSLTAGLLCYRAQRDRLVERL
jgi:lipopolysaccharide transport system permease protein